VTCCGSAGCNGCICDRVTLSLGDADGGTVSWSVDGTTWNVLTSPVTFLVNETVRIKAEADLGYTFRTWSGDLGGTLAEQTLMMNGNKIITAIFTDDDLDDVENWTLTLGEIIGIGRIEYRIGNGVWALMPATLVLPHGTVVELHALAEDGHEFSHWLGTQAHISDVNMKSFEKISHNTVGASFILVEIPVDDKFPQLWMILAIVFFILLVGMMFAWIVGRRTEEEEEEMR
jgi:hypothetical protein